MASQVPTGPRVRTGAGGSQRGGDPLDRRAGRPRGGDGWRRGQDDRGHSRSSLRCASGDITGLSRLQLLMVLIVVPREWSPFNTEHRLKIDLKLSNYYPPGHLSPPHGHQLTVGVPRRPRPLRLLRLRHPVVSYNISREHWWPSFTNNILPSSSILGEI